MTREILNLDDIRLLVDTFYTRVRNDHLLGAIFNNAIQDRWDQHHEKMYRFWQTILLSEFTYSGNPFPVHANLEINKEHFDHWVALFCETVDSLFIGEKANEAKLKGQKIAETFHYKMEHLKKETQNCNQ